MYMYHKSICHYFRSFSWLLRHLPVTGQILLYLWQTVPVRNSLSTSKLSQSNKINKFSENLHHWLTMFCANFLISSIFSTCFPTIFTTFIHTWLYWYYYKFKTMWTWWLVFIPLERYRYWNCAKHYHAVVQYTFQRLWWFVVDYGNYIDTDWTSTCPTAGFIFHNCTSKNCQFWTRIHLWTDRQTDIQVKNHVPWKYTLIFSLNLNINI